MKEETSKLKMAAMSFRVISSNYCMAAVAVVSAVCYWLWAPFLLIPLGFVAVNMLFIARAIAASARESSWPKAIADFRVELHKVNAELKAAMDKAVADAEAEEAESKRKAKLRGEEPQEPEPEHQHGSLDEEHLALLDFDGALQPSSSKIKLCKFGEDEPADNGAKGRIAKELSEKHQIALSMGDTQGDDNVLLFPKRPKAANGDD